MNVPDVAESKKRSWAWEDVLPFLLVPASSVGAWFLPESHLCCVFAILAFGVLFDLLSLFYHVLTLATGKYRSGFPLVGLLFYGWFVLAYRQALVAPQEDVFGLLLFKLLDLVLLSGFHLLCQLPIAFQGPREKYE